MQRLGAGSIWPLVVFIFMLLPLTNAFALTIMKGETFLSLESDSYSEPIPLHETRHHWRKGFKSGDEAYTHQLFTHGVRFEKWSLGVFARYDYKVIAAPDTLEIINLEENDQPLPSERSYQLYARGSHSKSRGLFFDYHFSASKLGNWILRTNLLYGYDLESFELSGQGTVTSDDEIVAHLELDYFYSSDKLLGRKNRSPSGHGFSFDLWGKWKFNSYEFTLEARDLFYQMHWHNAAHTNASADTDIVERDSNGFISLRPLVSGVEDYRSTTQSLEPRIKLGMMIPESQNNAWVFGLEQFHGHQFGSAGYRWFSTGGESQDGYQEVRISSRGPSLMYQWVKPRYQIGLAMDRWIDRAYSLTLNIAFKFNVL